MLSIMMVSSTYRCMIYSRRLVRLLALTGKPSTGQTMDEDVRRKSTLYYFGVGVGWGWGGGTAPPPGLTSHDLLGGRQTWMPRPTLTHVPHTLPSGTDSCGGDPPCQSSTAHRMRQIIAQQWSQADTPSLPYFPFWFLARPAQTGQSTCQTPTVSTQGWWRQGGHWPF